MIFCNEHCFVLGVRKNHPIMIEYRVEKTSNRKSSVCHILYKADWKTGMYEITLEMIQHRCKA